MSTSHHQSIWWLWRSLMNGELGGWVTYTQPATTLQIGCPKSTGTPLYHFNDKRYQYYSLTKPVIIFVVNFMRHDIFSLFWKGVRGNSSSFNANPYLMTYLWLEISTYQKRDDAFKKGFYKVPDQNSGLSKSISGITLIGSHFRQGWRKHQ